MTRVERGPGWELWLGDYREVLADVTYHAVITDPPFGAVTHGRQRQGDTPDGLARHGLGYESWGDEEVKTFAAWANSASTGWVCAMTSHDLAPAYAEALESHGRYVFAPLACVQMHRTVRLGGDGPANWADWLVVSRTRSQPKSGALPGAYVGKSFDAGECNGRKSAVVGAKPVWLMRAIVRDYSDPGDIVVDPCAGGGTTLLAAVIEGRRAIGAEVDPETFAKAVARLRRGFTPTLDFGGAA